MADEPRRMVPRAGPSPSQHPRESPSVSIQELLNPMEAVELNQYYGNVRSAAALTALYMPTGLKVCVLLCLLIVPTSHGSPR